MVWRCSVPSLTLQVYVPCKQHGDATYDDTTTTTTTTTIHYWIQQQQRRKRSHHLVFLVFRWLNFFIIYLLQYLHLCLFGFSNYFNDGWVDIFVVVVVVVFPPRDDVMILSSFRSSLLTDDDGWWVIRRRSSGVVEVLVPGTVLSTTHNRNDAEWVTDGSRKNDFS